MTSRFYLKTYQILVHSRRGKKIDSNGDWNRMCSNAWVWQHRCLQTYTAAVCNYKHYSTQPLSQQWKIQIHRALKRTVSLRNEFSLSALICGWKGWVLSPFLRTIWDAATFERRHVFHQKPKEKRLWASPREGCQRSGAGFRICCGLEEALELCFFLVAVLLFVWTLSWRSPKETTQSWLVGFMRAVMFEEAPCHLALDAQCEAAAVSTVDWDLTMTNNGGTNTEADGARSSIASVRGAAG